MKSFALGLAVLALLAAPAAASSTPPPATAVQQLNTWRSAVGVAPVAHDPALDDGCRRHAAYYRANPSHTGHREDPSAPGYSPAGDQAARSSVLSYGEGAAGGLSAWEPAPYHRMALLHPRLAATGFWSEFRLSCMAVTNVDNTIRTPVLAAYTYPVNGQLGVAPAFWCSEEPNPCEAVPGNGGRRPTGFNISLQFNGPWAWADAVEVTNATLTPVQGQPLPLTVQSDADVLRGGIVLIPHEPLALASTYVVTAAGIVIATADDGSSEEHPFAVSWSFSTPGIEPAASLRVSVRRVTRREIQLRMHLHSVEARRARISLLNGNTALRRVIRQIAPVSQLVRVPRPRERVTTVGVLLRGSAKHAGVAVRLPVDIPPG